ncbi:MAG TPA: fibronectin type III domain-containing protein [Terracidiphilus sp.]|nr:fibronectin type III domain-containing protein [Terracidiphilus sp.]
MILFERKSWAVLALMLCALLSGCGTPGAPQPPSLNLAAPVEDLSAIRTGDHVALTWTMPKRNTDKTALKADAAVRICRREGSGACNQVGTDLSVAAGKPGSFTDALPGSLTSGSARPVSYFVELRNKKGRSAGLSNGARVLAGEAPRSVEGLKAEMHKQGLVLTWTADGETAAVRLQRKLLTPPATKTQHDALAPAPEAINATLLVEEGAAQGRAMDTTIRMGESYEYRAQRVSRVDVEGKTLELAGEISAPFDVDAKDVFPPDVPAGLAAVATAGENGGGPAIDLSWQPELDTALAGYVVYRREGDGEWQRVSPATPSIAPAFHDADVQPGHSYRYAVSAVDKNGRESARSVEAEETVPRQ